MSDDLVERLLYGCNLQARDGKQAADEITALRARLAEVERDIAATLVRERDANKKAMQHLMQHLRKAEQLEIASKNLAAFSHEWRTRAERAEAALAQLEPRDGERWVTPDMIQYQYEWMEWLAGDQPLVPIDDLRAVQAALATARRDAVADVIKLICATDWPPPDGDALCDRIRALANETDTSARGMP